MIALDTHSLLVSMTGLAFILGFITFAVGVFILAFRVSGSEVQSLAIQTTRLLNKGLTDDMAGLVGQTSELLDAINQMVHSARGVGFVLIIMGLVLMVGASWLLLQLASV